MSEVDSRRQPGSGRSAPLRDHDRSPPRREARPAPRPDDRPAPRTARSSRHGSRQRDRRPRGSRASSLVVRWLNARGLRLAHAADFLGLYALLVIGMFLHYELLTDVEGGPFPTYDMQWYAISFLVTVVVFQLSFYFGGLYDREPRLGRPPVAPRAARQSLIAGAVMALIILAATGVVQSLGITSDALPRERALPMPIRNLATLMVVSPLWVAVVRQVVKAVRTRREGPPRVLLVGDDDQVALARRHLEQAARDELVEIVGFVHEAEGAVAAASRRDATDVLLLDNDELELVQSRVLPALEANGRKLLLRVSASDTLYGLQRLREVGGLPFLLVGSQAMPPHQRRFKRVIDLTAVLLLSPVMVPLTLLTAVYVRVRAGRPVLFWQTRVGAGGRTFRMVKFRTMVPDAEEDGRARLADAVDDRVVPGCGFLRSTRLDELPQLWNILRGEMGLVGPRPERPELTATFERTIPGYASRHEVPPGITGLAQIHGRYHTDAEYKLGYDLQYLVNWSPVLDLEILARTVWVVLTRRV